MSEIEQRLRAAMHAAVADEQPPANLLQRIRARRRRHRAATTIACMAVARLAHWWCRPPDRLFVAGTRPVGRWHPHPLASGAWHRVESCSRQIEVLNGPDLSQSIVLARSCWWACARPSASSGSTSSASAALR